MVSDSDEGLLKTTVTWDDFESQLGIAFGTDARLGAKRSVVDIGDGSGFISCCGLATCDWVGAAVDAKLPDAVVIKIPSIEPLRRLNDSLPAGQKFFNHDDNEKWAEMEAKLSEVHNTEVATYDFLHDFKGLLIPRKYYGNAIGPGEKGQLCLEYIANSRTMRIYEKHTVEQVRQIARALGKIQACSLNKEPTNPALHGDFFEKVAEHFPMEGFRRMFKGILTVDSSEKTKELMGKIDELIPRYHGSKLVSTLHEQMGYRPVIVNGDLHTGNVLIDSDTGDLASLIDWQCTHLGVGVEDLHRIAISALMSKDRRASMPMLVEEMYNSMVEHLDGVDAPYSLETLFIISDLIFPQCALHFTSQFISIIAKLKKDKTRSAEENAARMEVELDKVIGILEDVVEADNKNEKHIENLKLKNESYFRDI